MDLCGSQTQAHRSEGPLPAVSENSLDSPLAALIRWHEDLASCTIGTHQYLDGGRGSLVVAPIMGFSLSGSVALLGAPLYRGVSAIGGFSPFCGPERGPQKPGAHRDSR